MAVEDRCPADDPCRIASILTNGTMVAVFCQHEHQMPEYQGREHVVGPRINRDRGSVPWEDYSARRETMNRAKGEGHAS